MATLERRVRRAIEQVGQQQVRSSFETYISELGVRKTNSAHKAYLQDHGIVFKWDEMTLVRQLILLHPKLNKPQTDEEMIVELKMFLKIN